MLEGGSRILLDSNTRIEVKIAPTSRDLQLESGQARFQVAHDLGRSFIVTTAEEAVLATGTDFNVERLHSHAVVTLIEGRVVVSGPITYRGLACLWRPKCEAPIDLWPCEQPDGSADGTLILRQRVVLSDTTAWQIDKIAFDNETLSIATERISRYRKHLIQVSDRAVGDVRISGIFNTADNDDFVEAVIKLLPLRSTINSDGKYF